MKKIYVDQDVCIGCGACAAIAPDAYEFNDEGLAQVKKEFKYDEASSDLQNDVMDALEGCPTGAIKEED
ncbi:MAG: ferredoxin [Bacilli bacterium]|nr:ferredoxin [Bacilli bacterium]